MDDTEYPRRIKVDLKRFDFVGRERELAASADAQLDTLRLANLSRRFLAAVAIELATSELSETVTIADMSPKQAHRWAVTELALHMVRSLGAATVLVAHGYELESAMPARRVLEALVRAQQIVADESGDLARTMLRGHGVRGGFKQQVQKQGIPIEVVEWLDRAAHPDTLLLDLLREEVGGFQLLPTRGIAKPNQQLLTDANTAAAMAMLVAMTFEVEVDLPAFLARGLAHYKEHPLDEPAGRGL